MAKVVTATNGSMDNFLAEQNMEVSEQANSASASGPVPTVIPLKRKLDRSAIVKHTGSADGWFQNTERNRRINAVYDGAFGSVKFNYGSSTGHKYVDRG